MSFGNINRQLCSLAFITLFTAPSLTAKLFANPADSLALNPGATALQFGITQTLTLSSFQGAALSIKYHFSKTSALRLSIGLNGDVTSAENTFTGSDTLITITNEDSKDIAQHSVYLTSQYLWYSRPRHQWLAIFGGLGPFLNFSRSESNLSNLRNIYSLDNRFETYDTLQKAWRAGVQSALGVEWFFKQFMSLTAEYRFRANHLSETREVKRIQYEDDIPVVDITDKSESSGCEFRDYSVLFGLSVYL